jgi:hypothetical protein
MNESKIWTALAVVFVLLAMLFATNAWSNPKVKYCKNYETGEIIVIEDGYPCPFPTSEI